MPFRPVSNPDLAGYFMAAGIQRAGQSLGNAAESITKAWADKNKLKKAYVVQGEQLGFDKNFLETLGAEEVMGMIEGKKMKMAFDQMQVQTDAARDSLEQRKSGRAAFSEALQRFSNPPAEMTNSLMPDFLQRPITTRERMDNALAAPGLDAGGASVLAQVANQYADSGTSELQAQFMDIPGTDSVLATFGRSAYPVPKVGQGAPETKMLPNGGVAMWNGSRWIELRPKDSPVEESKTFFQTLVDGEKLLQGIDKQIQQHHDTTAFAKRDKRVTAPDAAALKDLELRRSELVGEIKAAREAFKEQQSGRVTQMQGGNATLDRGRTKLYGPDDEVVRVLHPDGKRTGTIPRSRLADALAAGYTLLEEKK